MYDTHGIHMRYHLDQTPLTIAHQTILTNAKILKSARFIILQHLVDDTYQLLMDMADHGCQIDALVGKKYSSDDQVVAGLQSQGFKPLNIEDLSDLDYLKILRQSIQLAKANSQRVIVLDIGGFFSVALSRLLPAERKYVAGVVEDTMFGYQRYQKAQLPLPVYEVATSPLKELEAVFVGRAVVGALEQILQDQGRALLVSKTLVIGFGMISRNIARHLKAYGIVPSILEIDSIRALRAYAMGFPVLMSRDEISEFDLIISATGSRTIYLKDMSGLKDGVMLVSGSSQDIEFDVRGLEKVAKKCDLYGPEIAVYQLKGKKIVVISRGTPINFRQKSVPAEIIDIMFAEIITAVVNLLKKEKVKPGLMEVSEKERQVIARQWLQVKNS